MTKEQARQLAAAVEHVHQTLNDTLVSVAGHSSDDSLALLRLRVGAAGSRLLTQVLLPLWREHPELAPDNRTAGGLASMRMSERAVKLALEGLSASGAEVRALVGRLPPGAASVSAALSAVLEELEAASREVETHLPFDDDQTE